MLEKFLRFSPISNRYLTYLLELISFLKQEKPQELETLKTKQSISKALSYLRVYYLHIHKNIQNSGLKIPFETLSEPDTLSELQKF